MVMKPEPIFAAVANVFKQIPLSDHTNTPIALLSPQGKQLNQNIINEFSKLNNLVLICGHYAGVDERVRDNLITEEISIGDYVLTGGEVAAQVLVEGCIRLLPGVLRHPESVLEESFSNNLLEYPQYTRPQVWIDAQNKEHNVPDILLSGHHEKIKEWRNNKSLEKTKKNRPDLLNKKK